MYVDEFIFDAFNFLSMDDKKRLQFFFLGFVLLLLVPSLHGLCSHSKWKIFSYFTYEYEKPKLQYVWEYVKDMNILYGHQGGCLRGTVDMTVC